MIQAKAGPVEYRGSYVRKTHELVDWHARSKPVAALEPGLAIVDAHHHLFGTPQDPQYYRMDDLRQDFDGGHRVVGTVYVEGYHAGWRTTGPEAMRSVGEVERIVSLTGQALPLAHGSCQIAAGIVACADLMLGEATLREVLVAHRAAAQGRLRGVRQRTATDSGTVGRFIVDPPKPHLLRTDALRKGCALLPEYGLSFDTWAYHHQLDEVAELADACPDTRIVIDHVGGVIGVAEHAVRKEEVMAEWRSALRALALRPNLHIKLGGLGMLMFGFGFEAGHRPATTQQLVQAWRPYIEACIEAFGTGRCMFESNFPVDKQSCGYTEMWNAYKLVTQDLSASERRDLFSRTACRVYRLPELEPLGEAGPA